MRTTIRMNDALLAAAKKYAFETGTTLTSLIEEALREKLHRQKKAVPTKKVKPLPVKNGKGLQPGVDLDDMDALLDVMEGR